MDGQHQRITAAAVVAVTLLVAAVLALAISAAPASAFTDWAHDGATGCVCHDQGRPTDATCTACHTGFQSFPGQACWSCHAPGQDTSTLSTPSAACSQECHLWDPVQKVYITPTTHGTNPHLGSTPDCLACHQTSPGVTDPGSSPHHSGQATGFTDCTACHSSLQQHAGKVKCTACHTTAVAFHLYQTSSPGFKNCRACHAMRHAGRTVPNNKCATCHKGSGAGAPSAAQHAKALTKKSICGGCHTQKLHASSVSSAVRNCRTCHAGKYHAQQRTPSSTVCQRCHTSARRHADGFNCTLCHRRQVHQARPTLPKIRG